MNDTDARAEAFRIGLLRQADATRRASVALRLSDEVVRRSRAALAERMPGATDLEVKLRWVELWYGADLAGWVRRQLAIRETA